MLNTRLFTAPTHYVIIANGDFLARDILLEATHQKRIIALDGAADELARRDITPHVILGDFDSITQDNIWGIQHTFDAIDENSKPYAGNFGTTIVPAKNQNETDLMKAIRYCDQHGAVSIHILCATGNRQDHEEGARRCLRTSHKEGRPIFLHTEQQTLRFATGETLQMTGKVGDKCGIVAFPSGHFTSTGLTYNGDNYELKFGVSDSICNSLSSETATITIKGEALLFMPPYFASQRNFSAKTKEERLWQLLSETKLTLPDKFKLPKLPSV